MIAIDFLPMGGGIRKFGDIPKLLKHIESEIGAWQAIVYAEQKQPVRDLSLNQISGMVDRWERLRQDVLGWGPTPDIEQASTALNAVVLGILPISISSAEGAAIKMIGEGLGRDAAAGAMLAAMAVDSDQTFASLNARQLVGVLHFTAMLNGITKDSSTNARASYRATMTKMQASIAAYEQDLVNQAADHQAAVAQLKAAAIADRDAFATFLTDQGKLLVAERDEREVEWNEIRSTYHEQLTILGPVTYWKERASEHQTAAKKFRMWLVGISVIGLALGIVLIPCAIEGANYAAGRIIEGSLGADLDAVQSASWKFELALLATVGLLYLTLYLWLVRVVMRMFLTEHHLSIDAGARAAMAYTYLALIKMNGADTADRAIVLAALFRPVTDGIVKDDSSVGISPASILSAGLASHR